MLFLRKEEVLDIHRKLLEQFGGLRGIREEGFLDSALLAAASRPADSPKREAHESHYG